MIEKDDFLPVGFGADFFELYGAQGQHFVYDLAAKDYGRLSVVWGGQDMFLHKTHFTRESYPFPVVSYVTEGNGVFEVHGRQHKLGPGMVSGHCPGVPHAYTHTTTAIPMKSIFVVFAGTQAIELIEKSNLTAAGALQVSNTPEMQNLFEAIVKESLNKTQNSQEICCNYLKTILLKLSDSPINAKGASSQAMATYVKCRNFIDENYVRISSPIQVANECFVDPAYLARLFKRFANITPGHYIMRLKLSQAGIMLISTDLAVKRIALSMGFKDPYYFSKKFKEFHGVSPRKYRNLWVLA